MNARPLVLLALFSPILYIDVGITIKLWHFFGFFFFAWYFIYKRSFSVSIFYVPVIFLLSNLFGALSTIGDVNITRFIYILFGPLQIFFAFLLVKECKYRDFISFVNFFLIINIVYGLYGFLTLPSGLENNSSYYGLFIQYGIPRLSGFVGDPNLLALYSVMLAIIVGGMGHIRLAGFLFVLVILTQSRTGILIILFLLMIFLAYTTILRFSLKSILAFFFFFMVLFFFSVEVYSLVSESLSYRLQNLSDLGGRASLWVLAYNAFLEHSIFGYGVGSSRDFVYQKVGSYTYLHNTPLEVLFERGLFGAAFLLFFIVLGVKGVSELKFKHYMLLITIFSFSLSLSILYNEAVWWCFGLTLFGVDRNSDFYCKYIKRKV